MYSTGVEAHIYSIMHVCICRFHAVYCTAHYCNYQMIEIKLLSVKQTTESNVRSIESAWRPHVEVATCEVGFSLQDKQSTSHHITDDGNKNYFVPLCPNLGDITWINRSGIRWCLRQSRNGVLLLCSTNDCSFRGSTLCTFFPKPRLDLVGRSIGGRADSLIPRGKLFVTARWH